MKRLVLLTLALLALSLQPAAATTMVSDGDDSDSGGAFSGSGHFEGFGTSFDESSAAFVAKGSRFEDGSFERGEIPPGFLSKRRFRNAILSHSQVADLRAGLWYWKADSSIRAGRLFSTRRPIVPEPSTGLLLGLGIAGLARRHRAR